MIRKTFWVAASFLLLTFFVPKIFAANEWPVYSQNPFQIKLVPAQNNISGRGGIIASDLTGDNLLDFIVTTQENDMGAGRATLAAYDHNGGMLWMRDNIDIVLTSKAEMNGLPGWHGPGVSVADIENDGYSEVIHLNQQNKIVIRNGADGSIVRKISVKLPRETFSSRTFGFLRRLWQNPARQSALRSYRQPKRWSHFQIVNLDEQYDDEIILQADPNPFRWLAAVSLKTGKVIWERSDYVGPKHGGFRAADIDGDKRDEVVGGIVIDDDGSQMNAWSYRRIPGHFDSLTIADILPNQPGLEWVMTEESHNEDDHTALLSTNQIYFYHSFKGLEPQNVAVGNFDVERPGLEIWLRSRFERDQKPWVIDGEGNTIASYRLNDLTPSGWTDKGIETITTINWDGSPRHLLAAKERHTRGNIALIDALTGEFKEWWPEKAARLYVADVAGDNREEIIVLNSEVNEIRIYWNSEESLSLEAGDRLWNKNLYQRQKLNYNYYST